MDQRLAGHYSVKGARRDVVLQCTAQQPWDRPRMAIVDVLERLQG